MARANRHYIPGYVWHITHRCHKREFLLTGECPAGGVKGHYRKTIPCREVLSQQEKVVEGRPCRACLGKEK